MSLLVRVDFNDNVVVHRMISIGKEAIGLMQSASYNRMVVRYTTTSHARVQIKWFDRKLEAPALLSLAYADVGIVFG